MAVAELIAPIVNIRAPSRLRRPVSPPAAAPSVFHGTVTCPVGTGTQAITGVGFTPKVIIFWCPGARTADGNAASATFGFGAGVSSTSRFAVMSASLDAVTTSDANRYHTNAHCILGINTAGTVVLEADLDSMDGDGFTLDWTVVFNGALINYLALGGTALTAAIKEVQSPTSTGAVAYTGVGFAPTALVLASIGSATAPPSTATTGILGLGFASGLSAQGAASVASADNSGTSITQHGQQTDKGLHVISSIADTVLLSADIDAFGSDGFTLDWTTVQASARYVWVICLAGAAVKVGEISQATGTGDQATSGVGFSPNALLLMSANDATDQVVAANARLSFGGGVSSSSRSSVWLGDTNGAAITIGSRDLDRTKIIKMLTEAGATPTTDAAADLSSFGADGFTLNWTAADATARKILYMAIGGA